MPQIGPPRGDGSPEEDAVGTKTLSMIDSVPKLRYCTLDAY